MRARDLTAVSPRQPRLSPVTINVTQELLLDYYNEGDSPKILSGVFSNG
jgi:hypothetical protein